MGVGSFGSSGKRDGTTLPRRDIGSFNGLVPSWLKTEEVPGRGLNAMTTSGRPAYGNLAGHPFGVNAK
jgi:hypothetical protein